MGYVCVEDYILHGVYLLESMMFYFTKKIEEG